MKFKARYVLDIECEIEADSSINAARELRDTLTERVRRTGTKVRILGVIPQGSVWPDTVETKRPTPRGTPPSGTPGTPVVTLEDQPVSAVAA